MALERKIVITADSDQAEASVEKMAGSVEKSFEKVVGTVEATSTKVGDITKEVASHLQDLDQTTTELFKGLIQDSEKYTSSVKERASYLDAEIRKLELINKEEDQRARIQTKTKYERAMSIEPTKVGKKEAKELFEAENTDNDVRSQMAAAQVSALRDKRDEYIRANSETSQGGDNIIVRNPVEVEKKTERAKESVSSGSGDVNRGVADRLQELDETTLEIFKELVQDSEKYSSSIKERAGYLDAEIKKLERLNKEEDQRARLQAKMRYDQKLLSSATDEDRKKAKDHFAAEEAENSTRAQMAAAQVRALKDKRDDYVNAHEEHDDDSGKGHVVVEKKTEESHDNEEGQHGGGIRGKLHNLGHGIVHGVGNALGFGALFSVGGFVHKVMHEGEERSKAEARAAAMGVQTPGVSGLKTADAISYAKQVALSAGTGEIAEIAQKQSMIERGTGMELGTLTPYQNPIHWMEEEKGKDVADVSAEMLSIMKKSGLYNIDKNDFTLTHELLDRNNQLITLQSQKEEAISTRTASQLQAAFGQVGGSFNDERQVSSIASINKGITDPGNDFKNAFIMRSIKQSDPNASLLDVMKAKEEGVFKEGQFAQIMKDIFETFQGDQRTFSISKLFGLNISQSERLAKDYEENPERFDQIGSTEEVEKTITPESIAARGGITEMEKITAKFDDKLSGWGSAVIHKIEEYIGAFDKGGFGGLAKKAFEDVGSAIVSGFEKGVGLMKKAFEEYAPKVGGIIDEKIESIPVVGAMLAKGKPIEGEQVDDLNTRAIALLQSEVSPQAAADPYRQRQMKRAEELIRHPNHGIFDETLPESERSIGSSIVDPFGALESSKLEPIRLSSTTTPEDLVERIKKVYPDLFNSESEDEEYLAERATAQKNVSALIRRPDFAESQLDPKRLERVKSEVAERFLDQPKEMNKAYDELVRTGTTTNEFLLRILELAHRRTDAATQKNVPANYATEPVN